MEEHAPKAINIWVSVIICLVIIGVVIGLVMAAKTGATVAQSRVANMTNTMEESNYTQYDGALITGSEVVSAIKMLDGYVINVSVNNGSNTTDYLYKADLTTKADGKVANATQRGNAAYITPKATYLGEVVRDTSTDVITTIKFTKQ